jgi:hypothetical protein
MTPPFLDDRKGDKAKAVKGVFRQPTGVAKTHNISPNGEHEYTPYRALQSDLSYIDKNILTWIFSLDSVLTGIR